MSVTVKKTTITMTRGDTARIKMDITNSSGETYIPADGDVIRFAAKYSYSDEEPCILKTIPLDTLELYLEPADTKSLEQPCTLIYDIELTMVDGTVDTFLKGQLVIEQEVY